VEFISNENPLETLLRLENKKLIREKLRQLNPKHILIIRLFYWEEMSSLEIARIINSTPNSIRSTLSQKRKKLREIFRDRQS
jgi:RNA polymerase sigma-70 factor (ECF subfamily)